MAKIEEWQKFWNNKEYDIELFESSSFLEVVKNYRGGQ